jgi:Glycosyl transferases group 1
MRFNICTNIDNGVGLQQDYLLLKGLLEGWGHQVNGVHFKRIDGGTPRADVNIFLETLASALFPKARQNWLIPNQEWYAPWDHTNTIKSVDKILCKTHDAVRIFKTLYPEMQNRVQYIGFESADLYDPSVPRKRTFLHVAGQSRYKNSPAVSYAFAKFFDDPSDKDNHAELVFIGAYPEEVQLARDHKNVRYIQRASDAELKRLTNECIFAIIPSGAEGWGHVLHQSVGCGACVITTNYPPMNEIDGICKELLVPYQRTTPELAAQRAFVGALEVKAIVEKARKFSDQQLGQIHVEARAAFLRQRENFRAAFKAIVEAA